MKKLIMASAIAAAALLVSACGDRDAETEDTAVVDETATPAPTATVTTAASADWPTGTRIVEEAGVTYRVNPDGARVVIEDDSWRIVTAGRHQQGGGADCAGHDQLLHNKLLWMGRTSPARSRCPRNGARPANAAAASSFRAGRAGRRRPH